MSHNTGTAPQTGTHTQPHTQQQAQQTTPVGMNLRHIPYQQAQGAWQPPPGTAPPNFPIQHIPGATDQPPTTLNVHFARIQDNPGNPEWTRTPNIPATMTVGRVFNSLVRSERPQLHPGSSPGFIYVLSEDYPSASGHEVTAQQTFIEVSSS